MVSAGLILPGAWAPFQMTTIEEGKGAVRRWNSQPNLSVGKGWSDWMNQLARRLVLGQVESSHNFGIQD